VKTLEDEMSIDLKIDRERLTTSSFIGIDVNLSGLGLAIIKYDGIILNFIDMVRQDEDINKMFPEWVRATRELFLCVNSHLEHRDTWNVVVIEDPSAMSAPNIIKKDGKIIKVTSAWQTADVLNRLTGMLSVVFIDKGYKCLYPSSVMWKSKVMGHGKAEKKEIQSEMGKLIMPNAPDSESYIQNHHIADSLALAVYGYIGG